MINVQRQTRLFRFGGIILGALIWLANSGNPPTGRTNAPFDGSCNDCHSGGNYNGTVEINGLPGTIAPNTTYNLSLTMTPTSGSPVRGGFQVVVVDGNNANSGNINNSNAQSGTEFFNTREYLEHRNPKNFGGNPITWDFTWQSPASAAGNTIKFYYIGNFCNGSGDNGDIAFSGLETLTFEGGPPLTCQITNQTNVDCFGGNTGSATVEADGGNPPYTYKWNNNQTTQTAVNLIAGTYTVTVTGGGTATATVVITQSPQISASATVNNPITCANPAATVTASASGGAGGFSFAWSNGDTGNPASYSNAGPGNVTITDNLGCTKVATFTVNSNTTEPNAVATAPSAFTCANPTMTLSGNGSSVGANFSYSWTASGGGTILSGGNTLNPLVSGCGTYTLLVTNNINGCTKEASVTPTCNINLPSLTTTGNTITCTNASVVITASSNASNPAYAWAGPNFNSNQQNPTVTTAGIYTCTVTNTANGCSKTATATVAQNTTAPSANAVGTGLNCVITSDTIFGSSNTNGVTYTWTGPNGFTSSSQNPIVSLSGDYILKVDNPVNGCASLDTAVVSSNTAIPNLTVVGATITCTITTVQICANSTTPNLTYAWSSPNGFTSTVACPNVSQEGTYTVTITNGDNGCTNTGSTTVNLDAALPSVNIAPPANLNCNTLTVTINASTSSNGSNFTYSWTTTNGNIQSGADTPTPVVSAAGTYNLLITNTANGCTATGTATVVQTPAVTASTTSTNVSCNGGNNGSVTAVPGGGNGSYTYLWSSGSSSATASNLSAGTYTVTITDGENCTSTASAIVSQPSLLTANATSTNQTAAGVNDGTATANPIGGTPNYSYLWSNNLSTQQITGLAPGSYTVTVTDANNCTAVQTVNVNPFNCNLSAETSSSNVICNGAANGSASVSTTGANGNIAYVWSNNQTTQTISNLAPGTYTVTVSDAANCTQVKNVSILEPPGISPNATASGETGAGQNNGTATAAPTGGTPGYTYLWNNNATTNSITGLSPGNYTVTITDSKNCTATQSVSVSPFNCIMVAGTSTTAVSCFGGSNGTASATAANSTGTLSYKWSTGATSISITGLTAGIYTVTITDGAGCTDTEIATVNQPPVLQGVAVVLNDVNCPLEPTGQVSYQATGGTAPYSFSASGGTPTGFPAGTYTVTITDNNSCTSTATFTIKSLDVTVPSITCPINVSICKPNTGFYPVPMAADNCAPAPIVTLVSGVPSGGSFDIGTTTQVFRATDLSGNSSTCSFNVTIFALPTASYTVTQDTNNIGKGAINLTPSTGLSPFSYEWKKDGVFYSKEEDLSGLNAGNYSVSIKDANGCETLIENIVIKNVVGSYEPNWINTLRLYPSPTESMIRLEATDVDIRMAQVMTPQGRMVMNVNPSDLQQEINVTELPSGIYYLRLTTREGWQGVIKWIKM